MFVYCMEVSLKMVPVIERHTLNNFKNIYIFFNESIKILDKFVCEIFQKTIAKLGKNSQKFLFRKIGMQEM